jgi:hypothetical protein
MSNEIDRLTPSTQWSAKIRKARSRRDQHHCAKNCTAPKQKKPASSAWSVR